MQGAEAAAVLSQLAGHLARYGHHDLQRALQALELARWELTDGDRLRRQLGQLPPVEVTPEVKAAWDHLIAQYTDVAAALADHVPANIVSLLFTLALAVR